MRRIKSKHICVILFAVTVLLLCEVSFSQINFEWQKRHDVSTFGAAYNSSFNNVAVDSSGNVYFTSLIEESNVVKILLNKYSSTGNLKWSKTYQTNVDGVTGEYGCIIKSDGKNSIYVASRYFDFTTNKILLLKYDSIGTMLWDRIYLNPGSTGDITGGMDIDKSGFIYITGNTHIEYDKCLVLKYKYNGDLVWNRNLQGSSAGNAIVVDQQGNSYIAGSIFSYSYGKDLMMTSKYDSSGVLKWTNSYGLNNQGFDDASTIVLDDSNNVIVGGSSYYNDWNCTTLKYKNSGTLVKYTNYMQNGFLRVKSIATDSRCNVYITGQSSTGTILIKYDAMLAYKGAVMPTDYSIRVVKSSGTKYLYVAGSKNYSSPPRTVY